MPRSIMRFLKLVCAVLLFTPASIAISSAADRINTDESGIAIKGYDTVAYFVDGKPLRGSAEFWHKWQGAKWLFVSEKHRDLFAREPNRYAPRYGGYCAGAMALGRIGTVDPEAWAIVEGRLYLNFLISGRDEFVKAPKPIIQRANANWDRLRK
jgi:YHS domain-containing protein